LTAGPLAIIAGGGALPAEVAAAAARQGPVVVFPIRGFADRDFSAYGGETVRLYDPVGTVAAIKRHGASTVVLLGGVVKPSAGAVIESLQATRKREEIQAILEGGDDNVLRGVIRFLESNGLTVVGLDAVAPELMAGPGALSTARPDPSATQDIEIGRALIAALGAFDVGQAVVVARRRVLGIEAVEGTDALLRRVRDQRRKGLIGLWRRRGRAAVAESEGGVLVKLAKPGQDRRADLPAIGPSTFRNAAAAGLAGVAVGAGQVLIIEREKTLATADRLGLWLWGFET
jgi:DUF1009 family protein